MVLVMMTPSGIRNPACYRQAYIDQPSIARQIMEQILSKARYTLNNVNRT